MSRLVPAVVVVGAAVRSSSDSRIVTSTAGRVRTGRGRRRYLRSARAHTRVCVAALSRRSHAGPAAINRPAAAAVATAWQAALVPQHRCVCEYGACASSVVGLRRREQRRCGTPPPPPPLPPSPSLPPLPSLAITTIATRQAGPVRTTTMNPRATRARRRTLARWSRRRRHF